MGTAFTEPDGIQADKPAEQCFYRSPSREPAGPAGVLLDPPGAGRAALMHLNYDNNILDHYDRRGPPHPARTGQGGMPPARREMEGPAQAATRGADAGGGDDRERLRILALRIQSHVPLHGS
ncbi:uncharacterized protein GLRG_04540 [Colletotrichum graminicola M1.001]|uniref:Uncharacterized protein n=1 Tax=Colletotrichum graminicola (strain M1.001 / M2 / FGSC 10212) TaxID=645133 RepID=E3QEU0_COLGM|nr:uncharacterized protein GLRG_04540 [Colletotrichum graminicola M1.001]EFQ29396.1 hypothetical protein GLRG_04540 [Colletotrichum graminicola M1.001]